MRIDEGNAATLRNVISEAAAEVPDFAVFEPHITLLGEVDATIETTILAAEDMAQRFHRFGVTLGRVEERDDYFQRLTLPIEDQSGSLARLRRTALECLGLSETGYRPHLSVAYGEHPAAMPSAIGKLDARLPIDVDVTAVSVVTGGRVESWRFVASFPLRL